MASTQPLPAAAVTGKRQDTPSPLHSVFLSLIVVRIKPCLLPPHVAASFTDERAGLRIFSEWPGQGCAHPISRKELEEQLCVSAGTRSKQATRLGSLSIRPEEVTYHPQAGSLALSQKSRADSSERPALLSRGLRVSPDSPLGNKGETLSPMPAGKETKESVAREDSLLELGAGGEEEKLRAGPSAEALGAKLA